MEAQKLPLRITPCPIIEAVFEIRFNNKIDPNAVFGIFFNVLKDSYPQVESLPIVNIPFHIREKDPILKYQPHFKILGDKFSIRIGPRVFTIDSPSEYIGWDNFSMQIFEAIEKVKTLNVIDQVIRLGLRYINFFEGDIFKNINLKIEYNHQILHSNHTVFRTEFEVSNFNNTLNIENNIPRNIDKEIIIGSVIDIDTSINEPFENFFSEYKSIVNGAHLSEKELFFDLITKEYLQKFNPQDKFNNR